MTPPLLEVRRLRCRYKLRRDTFVQAVEDVSFEIRPGEIFGLVGESGSGKSTIARCVMNIRRPDGGQVLFQGIDTGDKGQFRRHKRLLQTQRQLIFQDSSASLNPRMTLAEIITEPLRIHRIRPPRGSLRSEAAFQMEAVGLDPLYLDRYPPQLSGGQRQRAAIARALTLKPALLVADEPVAALDVSIQAQIANLFKRLQQEQGFALLFIAHDLAMVEYLCDRVGVLYQGRLVELAPASELFSAPRHPYTQALLSAMPVPDPRRAREKPLLTFDRPLGQGGIFREISPGHFVLQEGRYGVGT